MKYKFFIITILISIIFIEKVYSTDKNVLNNKIVVIDPGHGYLDPGTIYNDVYEKNINLQISLKLKTELQKNNVKVIITRDKDYDLSSPGAKYRKKSDFDNRINLINESNADVYFSIHQNYLNDSSYYGAQVFYTKGNETLADLMQRQLNNKRNPKMLENNIYMYKKIKIPGVLIECGFLSNSMDRKNLQDENYQLDLVKKIVEGLRFYFQTLR